MGERYDMVGGDGPSLAAKLGMPYPAKPPYQHISAVVVAWNEEHRLGPLLDLLTRWFTHVVVGVQESTDGTRKIAEAYLHRPTDTLIDEPHHGYGDASFPRLVAAVPTPWTFVVSCDEWPNDELLGSLGLATAYANQFSYDGVWVYFHSFTEGVEWKVPHGHLRLFQTQLGWPSTMHSRPWAKRMMWWPVGYIDHVRSLDEFVTDYIRIYELGRGEPGWEAHNRQQIHDACVAVAATKGWEWVQQFSWWPQAEAIAFQEEQPWLSQ